MFPPNEQLDPSMGMSPDPNQQLNPGMGMSPGQQPGSDPTDVEKIARLFSLNPELAKRLGQSKDQYRQELQDKYVYHNQPGVAPTKKQRAVALLQTLFSTAVGAPSNAVLARQMAERDYPEDTQRAAVDIREQGINQSLASTQLMAELKRMHEETLRHKQEEQNAVAQQLAGIKATHEATLADRADTERDYKKALGLAAMSNASARDKAVEISKMKIPYEQAVALSSKSPEEQQDIKRELAQLSTIQGLSRGTVTTSNSGGSSTQRINPDGSLSNIRQNNSVRTRGAGDPTGILQQLLGGQGTAPAPAQTPPFIAPGTLNSAPPAQPNQNAPVQIPQNTPQAPTTTPGPQTTGITGLPPVLDYGARKTAAKDFVSGNASKAINALETALRHVDEANSAFKDLHNSNTFPAQNKIWNAVMPNFDADKQAALTRYGTSTQAIGDELMKFWRGGGIASEKESERWKNPFSPNLSPKAHDAATEQVVGLISDKLNAYANQYRNAFGNKGDFNKLISDEAKALFKKYGISVGGGTAMAQPSATTPTAGKPKASSGISRDDVLNELKRRGGK